MLTIVNANKEAGLTVVKRSHPVTGNTSEYQVHRADNSVQAFNIEARFETKHEADDYLGLNENSRQIWLGNQ